MGLFITSLAQASRHGVYAIERTPPATIVAQGTGVCAVVDQFAWGPENAITTPEDMASCFNMFSPPGMNRRTSGHLSLIKLGWPILKLVRVLAASGTVKATATVNKTGPVAMLTLTAKYKGASGNSITATISAASDGDANHFDLTVQVTSTSGTTVDSLKNLNYSGTGTDSSPDFTKCLLIGGITKLASGIPLTGTVTFSSGADGSIASTDYVGTQGTADKGLALLEGDSTVRHHFSGDVGNTFRAAVNAGHKAHADYMGDRVGYIAGNSGLSASGAQSDKASYNSTNCVYVDPWHTLTDDTDGSSQLVPSASLAASVAAQLSPSTSIAWKASEVTKLINGRVVSVEANRNAGAATNTAAGIVTLINEPKGGFSFEAGVVTYANVDPSKARLTRTLLGIYIASGVQQSIRAMVDAPNVSTNNQNVVNAVDAFMSEMKTNGSRDPNHLPFVVDYAIGDLDGANSAQSIADGNFIIPLDVRTPSGMEKIILSIRYGESVVVTQAAA